MQLLEAKRARRPTQPDLQALRMVPPPPPAGHSSWPPPASITLTLEQVLSLLVDLARVETTVSSPTAPAAPAGPVGSFQNKENFSVSDC